MFAPAIDGEDPLIDAASVRFISTFDTINNLPFGVTVKFNPDRLSPLAKVPILKVEPEPTPFPA